MNILYFWAETNTYMDQWQRQHIFNELEANGHEIQVFNPINYQSIEEANSSVIPYIKKNITSINLFMTCIGSEYLYEETITSIKKIGIPSLLICFDNLHAPYVHRKIASSFDLVWLTSKETIGMFKNWGCNNIIFQPYAANPFKFIPHWDSPMHSLSFIGTPYGSRVNKLNLLTQAKIPCDVYADSLLIKENAKKKDNLSFNKQQQFFSLTKEISRALRFTIGRKVLYAALLNSSLFKNESQLNRNKFLNAHPSVSFQDMQRIYSNSLLSLNITELRNTYVLRNPIHKLHLRTFEIPMCGGLEISSYTDELAEYFEDGKEIVLYKSQEEFISKSKFYLEKRNETLCMKMKLNARIKAESEHTWMHRFNKIFKKI